MLPLIMAMIGLAQKKQQQNQADNDRISNSLNLGDKQSTQLEIPNGNGLGGIMGNGQQGGAMGLLGSLFNKNDPTKTAMPNRF